MTTNKQYATPVVQGHDVLTTRTDYVNIYSSVIQTSYNFSATETTAEVCAGVVKAPGIFLKNAAQHKCDLEILEEQEYIKPVFFNQAGEPKAIDCVVGASDGS